MIKLKYKLICIFMVTAILILISGCENGSNVKGIREKGMFEEEPTIKVKFASGQVENMKLEEYITGVVAGEMEDDWPQNAYGAQAILARTFALEFLENQQENVISSSYKYAQEYSPEKVTDTIREAVANTRGEVVLYQDTFIKGWFHSSAGGQTTTAKVGLAYDKDEPPYIKSVRSPDDEAPADIQNWEVAFSNDEIEKTLVEMGHDIGDLQELKAKNKDNTGRIIDFAFSGNKDSIEVKAANFRNQLDPKRLKSIKIDNIEKSNGGYKFTGSGFGHGVGLSQWGAYKMAKDNKSAEDIVNYYFKDVELVRVYD